MRPSYTYEIVSVHGGTYYARKYSKEDAVTWFSRVYGGQIKTIRVITTILDIVKYGTRFQVLATGDIFTKISGRNSEYNAIDKYFEVIKIDNNTEIKILNEEKELTFKDISIGQHFNLKNWDDCEKIKVSDTFYQGGVHINAVLLEGDLVGHHCFVGPNEPVELIG